MQTQPFLIGGELGLLVYTNYGYTSNYKTLTKVFGGFRMAQYLYVSIAEQLCSDIRAGHYKVHQKLPTESELAILFQTTRMTVRKAIDLLAKKQIVIRDKNHGIYVLAEEGKISNGLNGLLGFTENAKQLKLNVQTKILALHRTIVYPDYVATKLELIAQEPVWQIERLRLIEDEPMAHEQIYLKQKILPDLTAHQAQGSLYRLIEKQVPIGYASQELEAIAADQQLAELLKVSQAVPVFLAHTIHYSSKGFPLFLDNSHFRADKYTFHNRLQRVHKC